MEKRLGDKRRHGKTKLIYDKKRGMIIAVPVSQWWFGRLWRRVFKPKGLFGGREHG